MSLFCPHVNGGLKPAGRSGHVSVFYKGSFLVWGGYTTDSEDKYLPTTELWSYDVEASLWTRHSLTGDTPSHGLSGACAAVIHDRMYIFGGFLAQVGHTNGVYSIDLGDMTMRNHSSSIAGRSPLKKDKLSCWTRGTSILFFGGFGEPPGNVSTRSDFVFEDFPGSGWNNELVELDCSDSLFLKWHYSAQSGNVPCPRAAHACAQIGHTGYLFGGRFKDERMNDLYSVDLRTLYWTSLTCTGRSPPGRSWHVLAKVSEEHLFLYGGFDTDGKALKDVWIFHVPGLTWSQLQNGALHLGMSSTRMWHTACHSGDAGEIFIFGGCENSLLDPMPTIHSNSIVVFRFTALPLQRLCLDVLMCNYGRCSAAFPHLPRSLRRRIHHRAYGFGSSTQDHGKLINSCALM